MCTKHLHDESISRSRAGYQSAHAGRTPAQHKDPAEPVWYFASPTGVWMTMETAVSGEDKLFLKSAFVSFSQHRGQTMTSVQQTCTDSAQSAIKQEDIKDELNV